ncbi:iron ABC transporter permease [Pilimelia terevasa]|uniref:Iron ABC transporter permease n=1 Tax=Pilimelia terevasa TaxID=53372 RepID=A0A8J3BLP7_9ACTN|nr:iron ABC transporter permease [Pilimelia terevasa]GGK23400.1 iron ABC transporter permease [Pilimelia terevasa]
MTIAPVRSAPPPDAAPQRRRAAAALGAGLAALLVLCVLSVAVGSRGVGLADIVCALTAPGDDEVTAIVRGLRVPRTALGLLAGAALGLAGALMQAITRNPLADPGIFGVSAGAAFGIAASIALFGLTSLYGFIWFALLGALAAGLLAQLIGSLGRTGATPVSLALAGVAVSTLLGSMTSAVVLTDPAALNRYRFWSAGSLAGQDAGVLVQVAPFVAAGTVLALALAPQLNSLALGDDVARGLGRHPGRTRALGIVAVTLLTGAAVAVAGPIVFLGLVIPHLARFFTGPDHRWLLPLSAVLAPCLLLAADILGRVVARPSEIQVGVLTAVIGGPFFVALVRRRRIAEL